MNPVTDPQSHVLDCITGLGLSLRTTEHLADHPFWDAEVAGVCPFMIDGRFTQDLPETDPDCDADELAGFGDTRDQALTELARMLTRVTYGVITEFEVRGDRPVPRVTLVAWDGRRLAPFAVGEPT